MNAARITALTARSLARLVADRVALGLVLLFFVLTLLELTMLLLQSSAADPAEKAAVFRTSAWSGGYEANVGFVALVLGLNALAADIRRGTIFAVLARPVTRATVFVSSWLASLALVWSLVLVRQVIVIALYVGYGGRPDVPLFVGIAGLFAGTALALTAAACLGAVLPVMYGALAVLGWAVLQGLAFAPLLGIGRYLALGLASLLPLVGRSGEDLTALLTGRSRELGAGLEALLYRACWTLLLLVVGQWLFTRRDLAPRI
ncbi:MAG: hypothetical protein KBD01_16420 [Acidobacteria bacterium]|nr:hypothetical protein [Acidobacteriota bacterium]